MGATNGGVLGGSTQKTVLVPTLLKCKHHTDQYKHKHPFHTAHSTKNERKVIVYSS